MLERPRAGGPAETVSDSDSLTEYDGGPPLDLVHLAHQCGGDHELEDELLALFRVQSRALAAQFSVASATSLESKARIAHTLRGSALAVGAPRVADAARRIEEFGSAASERASSSARDGAALTRAIAALEAAVDEAVAEIERIRG